MGGVPCWITITCGGLSAAANALALSKDTHPELSDAAIYLAGVEDEICELGDNLAPFLSDDECDEVFTAGENADKLRARIVGAFDSSRPAEHVGPTAAELWLFAEKQRSFFLKLVTKYRAQ